MKLFRTIMLLCGIIMFAAMGIANAQTSGTTGDLQWEFADGALTITGTGAMPDYDYGTMPWFEHMSSITGVTVGDGVTGIGNWAFAYCANITSVSIAATVTSIGNYTFRNCTGLTSFAFPNMLARIGDSAFAFCSGLTAVSIPESVTVIGEGTFRICTGLTSIDVAPANPNYSSESGVLFNKNKTVLMQYPGGKAGEYTIPNTVTAIADDAFGSCSGLTAVTIPNSIITIGGYAFSSCPELTSIIIPNSVTTIDIDAFSFCTGLTSVTIGSSVATIGEYTFSGCSGLTEVINRAATPQTITADVFNNVNQSACTLRVLEGSVAAYEAADVWKNFMSIEGIEDGDPCDNPTATGTAGELEWILCPDGMLTITGEGAMPDYFYYDEIPWWNQRESISQVIIGDGVTSIGNNAFYDCSGLTSITIPESVTAIGESVFSDCTGLTSIAIPGSVTAIGNECFIGCSGLTSIEVASSNTSYSSENGVLFNKDKTTLIQYPIGKTETAYTVPESVTAIGRYAFSDSGLTSVIIPNSVITVEDGAFNGCFGLESVIIPNSVTELGSFAFYYCSGLTSVTIGNSVITVGNGAFYGCASLMSVTVPNSVITIGDDAFSDCSSLTSVTIGNSVTTIGDYAFYLCSGLTSITIGSSVTTIGDGCFSGCSGLTSIEVASSNPSYSSENGVLFNKDKTTLIMYPVGKTETAYTVPESVTAIENRAFSECSGLTSVIIPNSVITIGDEAFSYCSGLTSVTIGNSVTAIGDYAFSDCTSLTEVTNHATVPQLITVDVFMLVNLPACTLRAPEQSLNAYRTAEGWKEFGSIVATDAGINSNMLAGVTVYVNGNSVHIVNPNNINLKSVQVLDVLGRVVYDSRDAINRARTEDIPVNGASGIYIVQLTSEDGKILSTKVRLTR